MAKQIPRQARYRLAAAAFAASGAIWCLSALAGGHGITLLVVGMMNFAASMLIMSLRPPREACPVTVAHCERCSRPEQTVGISVTTIGIAGPAETRETAAQESQPAHETLDATTRTGDTRPRERKNRTWSI